MFIPVRNFFSNYNMKSAVAIIIVSIIIILFSLFYYIRVATESDLITGTWIATPEFCKQTDIDTMIVYIGPVLSNGLTSAKRKVYIIMKKNDTFLLDDKYEFEFGRALGTLYSHNNSYKLEALTDEKVPFPTKMEMIIDLGKGNMEWKDDKTTYLLATKNFTVD